MADTVPLPPPAVREDLVRGLSALYEELDRDIAALRPVCRQSGECCRFGSYGHRLYATGAEAAYFALRRGWPAEPFAHDACPYLRDGRCTAREARPLGCRVFFCDPSYKGKGEELTERYLRRIGALSDRLGIPRDYRTFLSHLDSLRETSDAGVSRASEASRGKASWRS